MTASQDIKKTRTRRHRRTVLAGLATSVVLHGVVLGVKTSPAPAPRTQPADPPEEPVRFAASALEVVQLEIDEPVKPVPQETKAPTPAVEPNIAEPAQEPAGAAREASIALSMRPDFSAQHRLTAFALQPMPMSRRPAAEAGEDEEERGRSFWDRLGISTGRGGGACPIPRKPGSYQAG